MAKAFSLREKVPTQWADEGEDPQAWFNLLQNSSSPRSLKSLVYGQNNRKPESSLFRRRLGSVIISHLFVKQVIEAFAFDVVHEEAQKVTGLAAYIGLK